MMMMRMRMTMEGNARRRTRRRLPGGCQVWLAWMALIAILMMRCAAGEWEYCARVKREKNAVKIKTLVDRTNVGKEEHAAAELRDQLERRVTEYKAETRGGARRGHLIPGVMWILWASWWHLNLCLNWARARLAETSSPSPPLLSRPHRLAKPARAAREVFGRPWFEGPHPWISCGEPIIKVALGSLGILFEIWLKPPGNVCYHALITARGILDPQTANLWVHVSMYGSIVLSGACDLLCWKGLLPDRFDSVAHVAVFANVGSLFGQHLTGGPLSVMCHKILVGLLFCYSAVAAADLLVPRHRWVPLTFMRVFFLFALGSWIIQTGKILFPPDSGYDSITLARMTARDLEWFTLWQLNPHASMAAVPVFLSLVCCCVFVAMCATLVLATFALGGFSRRRLEAAMRWAGDAKGSSPPNTTKL